KENLVERLQHVQRRTVVTRQHFHPGGKSVQLAQIGLYVQLRIFLQGNCERGPVQGEDRLVQGSELGKHLSGSQVFENQAASSHSRSMAARSKPFSVESTRFAAESRSGGYVL